MPPTDYRTREIARRAIGIRNALMGRDRLNTNLPPSPFVLFGKPVDESNADEMLVAATKWAVEQATYVDPFPR